MNSLALLLGVAFLVIAFRFLLASFAAERERDEKRELDGQIAEKAKRLSDEYGYPMEKAEEQARVMYAMNSIRKGAAELGMKPWEMLDDAAGFGLKRGRREKSG